MKIMINGINANLRFSSAHLIPTHESCGFIHGHSYFVDVEIEGERSGEFDFVVDFKEVKNIISDICSEFDHRFLVPAFSDELDFKGIDTKDSIIDKLDENKNIQFKIGSKGYTLPRVDCVLLPCKYTSAEDLSKFFVEKLFDFFNNKNHNLSSISACVNEGIGQGAVYTKTF